MQNYFSDAIIDFSGRFWRCKTYYSDAKSTSVADFDDAKLVLAMNNRLRWPILTMQNLFSDAKSTSVADFDDAKLVLADFDDEF